MQYYMTMITKIVSRFGYIEVFINKEKSIIYAIPNGYVGPSLVKKDLAFLADFDLNSKEDWTYIVDTSKVKVVNPINPFLLKGLKQFSKMKEYVVYAPSPIVRLMLQLTNWINKPDRVIKEDKVLRLELKR